MFSLLSGYANLIETTPGLVVHSQPEKEIGPSGAEIDPELNPELEPSSEKHQQFSIMCMKIKTQPVRVIEDTVDEIQNNPNDCLLNKKGTTTSDEQSCVQKLKQNL